MSVGSDPAGRRQVPGVGSGSQVGVGRLDHVGKVLGQVVAKRRDLDRRAVPLAEVRATQHAEVDGLPVWDIADGVYDLAHVGLLEVLPVDQHLLAAGVNVHDSGMVGRDDYSAGSLQARSRVVWLALAHSLVSVLLAAPASIASTKRIAAL